MPRLVRDDGKKTARLVLIGEAPGAREDAQGIPFVGPAGGLLRTWWNQVGLERKDFYITNVYPYRPPRNKLELISDSEIALWVERLHERLASLRDPYVIVPTGNTALKALTGKTGITKYRGSILSYRDRANRTIKVIPTIHPAALFRAPEWEARCLRDWHRIAQDSCYRELRLPKREHVIHPTLADLKSLESLCLADPNALLAIDIETPRKVETEIVGYYKNGRAKIKRTYGEPRIACIAFAPSPFLSITIPTVIEHWKTKKALAAAWDSVRKLCSSSLEKVLQNGLFDAFYLREVGIEINNWRWDTMAMHHCLDPTEDHDLAFMASVDTREPYWKDEGKDLASFWTYCGKDASVTCELGYLYRESLEDAGRTAFYCAHYQRLLAPLLDLSTQGVRFNEAERRRRAAKCVARCVQIQDELEKLAGEPLHGETDLSPVKLKKFFYETLKLPRRYAKGTSKERTLSTSEVVVRRLMNSHARKFGEAGALILEHRRASKLKAFYGDKTADADGRVRCSYSFSPETGRLSSTKNPKRTGMNLQNVDREARDLLLPDEGHIMLEGDLSQVENRIVGMLTGDAQLIKIARTPPWEFDVHRFNASTIFSMIEERRIPPEDVTKQQRYIGKRVVHAANYGMRGNTLSDVLVKEGHIVAPDECQRMIDAYLNSFAAIRQWQLRMRQRVIRDKALTNTWGRMIDFAHARLSDELFRRAYAFIPQSDAADLLNMWGLVPLHTHIVRHKLKSRIRLHVHDSLVVSCPREEAWEIASFLLSSLERPRLYGDQTLVVPVTVRVGSCYGKGHEFIRPPTREEFESCLPS